jgi:hypothetical protein
VSLSSYRSNLLSTVVATESPGTAVTATELELLPFSICKIGVGGYPKNSDNYPNTSGDLNTFEYTVRAQRDSDALRK